MQNEFTIEWTTLTGILSAAKIGYYDDLFGHLGKNELEEYDALLNLRSFLCYAHGELKIIVK